MLVLCVIADVVHAHLDESALAGALQDTAFKIRRKNFGQEREDFELHGVIVA